jgi:hypothetical protein
MTRKEICQACLNASIQRHASPSNPWSPGPWSPIAADLAKEQVELGRCYRTGVSHVPPSCEYRVEIIVAEQGTPA